MLCTMRKTWQGKRMAVSSFRDGVVVIGGGSNGVECDGGSFEWRMGMHGEDDGVESLGCGVIGVIVLGGGGGGVRSGVESGVAADAV